MKRLVCRTLFAALSVTIFSLALVFSGCTEKKNPAGPEVPPDSTVTPPDSTTTPPDSTITPPDSTITPPEGVLDPKLILGDGFAWVYSFAGLGMAYIFNADGTVERHNAVNGRWNPDYSSGETIWYTDGDTLYLEQHSEEDGFVFDITEELEYRVSGTTLTLDELPYQKTVWPIDDEGEELEYDPRLVNTVWYGDDVVYSFMGGDGSMPAMGMYDTETDDGGIYSWRTSEGTLYLTMISFPGGASEEVGYPYEINGDELTFNGMTLTLEDDDDDDDDDWDWEFAPKSAKQLLKAKLPKSLGKKLSLLK